MITIKKSENQPVRQDSEFILVEIEGLSTDTKPTMCYNQKIANGSVFIEIDTQDIFFYDAENEEWKGA